MPNSMRAPCDQIASAPASSLVSKKCEKWVLTATILGSSMAFIDGTIVNVALPALQDALHTNLSELQWVIEAYALTLASLLLLGGAMGDLYGRRIIFIIGTIIFTLASIFCGFAFTISQLIAARAIQGVGAALLVPGSLAIISASFSQARRGQAIGTWAGFTSITTAAGPVIGGWLVQHISWRLVFFLNIPLAIIVLILTLLYLSESKNQQARGLDILGAILATAGFAAIVFGLINAQYHTGMIFVFEMIGILLLLGFFYAEKLSSSPMVPLEMFRSRNFTGANLITFFLYFALYGVLFFFPLDLIQVQAYTPTQAGAALLPLILLIFLLSRWSGGLINRIGPKLPLIIGPAIAGLGFVLFLRSGIGDSYWIRIFPATFTLGIGMAISIAPLTTVVMNSVAQEHVGTASGINNAVSRIAGLLAIAILGLVLIMVFNQQLPTKLNAAQIPPNVQEDILNQKAMLAGIKTDNEIARRIIQESFVDGYEAIIWIAVILSFASALSAALFIIKSNPKIPFTIKR